MPWYSMNRTKRTKSSNRRPTDEAGSVITQVASAYPDQSIDQGVSGWPQEGQYYIETEGENDQAGSSSYNPPSVLSTRDLTGARFHMPQIDLGESPDRQPKIRMTGWPIATFRPPRTDYYYVAVSPEQAGVAASYVLDNASQWQSPDGFGGTWLDPEELTQALKDQLIPSSKQRKAVECLDGASYEQEELARLRTEITVSANGRSVTLHIAPALPRDVEKCYDEPQ